MPGGGRHADFHSVQHVTLASVLVCNPLLAEHRVVAWKGGKTLSPNFLWALTLALSQLAAAPATVADATQRRPKRARSEVLALPAPPDQHAH